MITNKRNTVTTIISSLFQKETEVQISVSIGIAVGEITGPVSCEKIGIHYGDKTI